MIGLLLGLMVAGTYVAVTTWDVSVRWFHLANAACGAPLAFIAYQHGAFGSAVLSALFCAAGVVGLTKDGDG